MFCELVVPYGRGSLPRSRVYDDSRLAEVLRDFAVIAAEYYYTWDGRHWILSDRSRVSAVDGGFRAGRGVDCPGQAVGPA